MGKTEQEDFIKISEKKFNEIAALVTRDNDKAFIALATDKIDIKAAICGRAKTVRQTIKRALTSDRQLRVLVESALNDLKFEEVLSNKLNTNDQN